MKTSLILFTILILTHPVSVVNAQAIQPVLWSIMAAPLIATNNLNDMNAATKRILMNEEVKSDTVQNCKIDFNNLGLTGNYHIRDLWMHKIGGKGKGWKGNIGAHETKMFRLTK